MRARLTPPARSSESAQIARARTEGTGATETGVKRDRFRLQAVRPRAGNVAGVMERWRVLERRVAVLEESVGVSVVAVKGGFRDSISGVKTALRGTLVVV